jgi:hypothetical protein
MAVTVGAADDGASRDTELVAGATTQSAAGGGNGDGFCGGTSGNGNEGFCFNVGEGSVGGGGAGGIAPGTGTAIPGIETNFGDGGPGAIVDDLAATGSLFDGVSECFGGGGASAYGDIRFSDVIQTNEYVAFEPNTPGCGGGTVTTASVLPIVVSDLVPVGATPANTGGGGPAILGNNTDDLNTTGSDGVVVVRYQVSTPDPGPAPAPEPEPEPTPDPSSDATTDPARTLPATGLSTGDTMGLGVLLTGAGLGAIALERRLRAAHR